MTFYHLRAVLQRLLENKLYVKEEKCEFDMASMSFLCFLLQSGHFATVWTQLRWPQTVAAVPGLHKFLLVIYLGLQQGSCTTSCPHLQQGTLKNGLNKQSFERLKTLFSATLILCMVDLHK